VVYDETTGQPLRVAMDPEAVAVDGGLAFTLTPLVVLAPLGFLDLHAWAGPQCPVQKYPADSECGNAPVVSAEMIRTPQGSGAEIPVFIGNDGAIFVGGMGVQQSRDRHRIRLRLAHPQPQHNPCDMTSRR
jgi:hypothetical protein